MSHMTAPRTATSIRAAAAERQRRRRARLAQQAPARESIECRCCGQLFVPTRQGRYCSRQCVERAGAFRRRLQQRDQHGPLSTWLGAQRRGAAATRWFRSSSRTATGIGRAWDADEMERRRLLQDHRHLLEPMVEAELIAAGWLFGPLFRRGRESAMAQVDPEQARERLLGGRW